MRTSTILVATWSFLAVGTHGFGHYAEILKRWGDLSENDAAKLDGINRDPAAAERLVLEHQKQRFGSSFGEKGSRRHRRNILDLALGVDCVRFDLQIYCYWIHRLRADRCRRIQ